MASLGDFIIKICDIGFGTIESARRLLVRPNVETISTDELRRLLVSVDQSVVLIDVRGQSEQAVSKIPGAITQQEYEAGPASFANKKLVVYCTVGGRSYLYARKLVAAGIDAKNYRDGILGWCRAVLPLETPDGRATNEVNPYWRIFRVPEQYEVKV